MEAKIRKISKEYLSVEIKIDDTTIDMGIFTEKQAKSLAQEFEEIVDSLLSGW